MSAYVGSNQHLKDLTETVMRSGSEEGSYLRLVDGCSLNSRLESNKEEEGTTVPLRSEVGTPYKGL